MPKRTSRRRTLVPKILTLESRTLLSGGLEARWVGQDRHDLVGPSSLVAPDGVQDIHISLSSVPASRTIAWAKIEGLGGGEWQYQGPWGPWAAAVVRQPNATTADIYADPYQVEAGRPFSITLLYDDGTSERADFAGGSADPNLRMPSALASVAWVGQDGGDRVGPGPAVGPDGIQDLRLSLGNLSSGVPITGLVVSSSSGAKWAYGTNPLGLADADLNRSDTTADLYLNPLGNPDGQTFTITISYANGKTDVATISAQAANPSLAAPGNSAPIPTFRQGVTSQWVGQDGGTLAGLGSAKIAINGLPQGRSVVAASLSNEGRSVWVYRSAAGSAFWSDAWASPLGFQANGTGAQVAFAPDRDESDQTMTLRLAFDDGTQAITRLVAGSTDPGLRANEPEASSVVAKPGDDLSDLASKYGTIHLSAGVYPLSKPLILIRPVAILADPGVTLRFSQASSDPAWSAAIKIHASHTTLDGFAVRFAASIRWADVSYGAAVIGTTDNLDTTSGDLKTGLILRNLDLESSPVTGQAVEAPRLIRVVNASGGWIEGNRLRGGTVEFRGGPWTIINNTYLGTVANTYTWTAFAGHNTHNLVLSGNHAEPVGSSGKTWRFLVLTGTGEDDLIASNTIVGIGPRDGDTEDRNAAEIILTESYRIKFEGTPSSISSDGRILRIPSPQGDAIQTGDMVAILSGPSAGQYRRVSQTIGPQMFLLDQPLPAGAYAISIASGFVDQTFRGNTIDARGGSAAGDLILVGNHYGTTVADNHFLGGNQAFKISSSATEAPEDWGWSHSPFFGATISGNVVEDSVNGGTISVEHGVAIKSTTGRVYFSGSLRDNSVVWSSIFLNARGGTSGLNGLTIGDAGSLDPNELAVSTQGNSANVPTGASYPSLHIVAGQVDGKTIREESRTLAQVVSRGSVAAPTGLTLVNDTGLSAADRDTNDGRIRFNPVVGATGYEYLISGAATHYSPVNDPNGFLPEGLTQVSNTILVRAFNAQGQRSADASYQFTFDTSAPIDSGAFLSPSNDTGVSAADRVTRISKPSFGVNGDPTDTMILLRNGQEVASRIGPGMLQEPIALPDGNVGYSIRRLDAAGNVAVSAAAILTIDTTAPTGVLNLRTTNDGQVAFNATGPDDRYEYQSSETGAFTSIDRRASFAIGGMSRVGVRAIDVAGNVGSVSWITINASTPSGSWIGQDGIDRVGPSSVAKPDGIQDIHIRLQGLKATREIAVIEVVGLGGSQWRYGGAKGPWKAALVRASGASTADLFVQPDRKETGRSFRVTIRYADGTTSAFWIEGGTADPSKRMAKNDSAAVAPQTKAQKLAARRAARRQALAKARAERLKAKREAANPKAGGLS